MVTGRGFEKLADELPKLNWKGKKRKTKRCFLSEETQSVASTINQLLQCALDLRCCFTGDMWNTQVDHAASSRRLSEINKAQGKCSKYPSLSMLQFSRPCTCHKEEI
uniref:Uncharacterized protein n=1 Tax=Cucumis sativus TaxID=3659 RepID=A0A0A0L630_CUCSA